MVRIITEKDLDNYSQNLPGQLRDYAYNGLDVVATHEIQEVLWPRLRPEQRRIYAFERALQQPALAMMIRGARVDEVQLRKMTAKVKRLIVKQTKIVNKLPEVAETWDGTETRTGKCRKSTRKDGRHTWPRGEPDETRRCVNCDLSRLKRKAFNPNSPKQCAHLFWDLFAIKPIKNKQGKVSVDEFVLEKIMWKHPQYKTVAKEMLEYRGKVKELGFLKARRSLDGRMRQTVNVGGPETGRFASHKNPFGEGFNFQNLPEWLRRIIIADPGMDIGYADLEQAESRVVAYVAGDEAYINAHLSGDVHTYVTRMVWPDLPWTGDLVKDKAIAKQASDFDPDHSWRDAAKRVQHGLNYLLTPRGLAAWAHIPVSEAEHVYEVYFTEFPGIFDLHTWVREQVSTYGVITTPLGRRRDFFGRTKDPRKDMHVIRQAVAFIPQSTVAEILNLSLWRIWRDHDPGGTGLKYGGIQLLAQVHDAILYQVETGDYELPRLLKRKMEIPTSIVDVHGTRRTMTIPSEVAQGKNWRHKTPDNPNGIRVIHKEMGL